MIVDYLQANRNFGMRIEVSREEVLLDTGGGLKKAAWFFLESRRSTHRTVPRAQRRCPQHHRSRAHGALPHRTQRPRHIGRSAARHFAAPCSSTSRASSAAAARPRCRNRVGPSRAASPSRSPFLAFTSFRRASSSDCPRKAPFPSFPPICVSPLRAKRSSPFAPMNSTGAILAGLRTSPKPNAIWRAENTPQFDSAVQCLDRQLYCA